MNPEALQPNPDLSQVQRLITLVHRLRGPDGCPWDKEQTHASLRDSLIDETYEFFEALDENNSSHMCEELGDLLLVIALQAQIASENGTFTIEDAARSINEKIIRRHPHVFGTTTVDSVAEVLHNWEAIKRTEKDKQHRTAITDGIAKGLPALFKAEKIQRRTARVGFDWPDIAPVLDKVEEEFAEFREALESGDAAAATDELGDILFALVNVARHRGISAETALQGTVAKFDRRFRYVEKALAARGLTLQESNLKEMDILWEESKSHVG